MVNFIEHDERLRVEPGREPPHEQRHDARLGIAYRHIHAIARFRETHELHPVMTLVSDRSNNFRETLDIGRSFVESCARAALHRISNEGKNRRARIGFIGKRGRNHALICLHAAYANNSRTHTPRPFHIRLDLNDSLPEPGHKAARSRYVRRVFLPFKGEKDRREQPFKRAIMHVGKLKVVHRRPSFFFE